MTVAIHTGKFSRYTICARPTEPNKMVFFSLYLKCDYHHHIWSKRKEPVRHTHIHIMLDSGFPRSKFYPICYMQFNQNMGINSNEYDRNVGIKKNQIDFSC